MDLKERYPIIFWTFAALTGVFTLAVIAALPHTAFLVIALAALYFLPTIVAEVRGHQTTMVMVLNVFLGWTLIGWVVALAIACGDRHTSREPARS